MSELLTVEQVAEILQVSPETVTRRFASAKGVIDIGTPSRRRRYRVLRIPRSVVEKYVLSKGGRIVVPDPPAKKPSRPASPPSADELALQLAAVARQHGTEAQKTLDRIAERARLMQYVPPEKWQIMVWLDEEEC